MADYMLHNIKILNQYGAGRRGRRYHKSVGPNENNLEQGFTVLLLLNLTFKAHRRTDGSDRASDGTVGSHCDHQSVMISFSCCCTDSVQ